MVVYIVFSIFIGYMDVNEGNRSKAGSSYVNVDVSRRNSWSITLIPLICNSKI